MPVSGAGPGHSLAIAAPTDVTCTSIPVIIEIGGE
jgi:hypothetical protein